MEADLNVNLKSTVRKGRNLSKLNYWRSLTYVTGETSVLLLGDRDIFIKNYKVKIKNVKNICMDQLFTIR